MHPSPTAQENKNFSDFGQITVFVKLCEVEIFSQV